MEDEIVPMTIFVGMTVVFGLYFWFRYRMRNDMQQTIRAAIDKGQELSPEIIDRLGQPQARARNRDLRWSLIWFACTAGLASFGTAMAAIEPEVQRVFLGISAFPFFLGIAYAIMWRVAGRET